MNETINIKIRQGTDMLFSRFLSIYLQKPKNKPIWQDLKEYY